MQNLQLPTPVESGPRISAQLRAISLEYSGAELAEATNNWSKEAKLSAATGHEDHGEVYKGELQDGSDVAIKVIDLGAITADGQGSAASGSGFEEEVATLSKFRHPNIVTLLGWGKHERMRYLIYELLGGGSALQRLSNSKQGKLAFPWHQRLNVLQDAGTGLSHMHKSKPKGFHRAIKSANIMLDRHGTAKMANFGLSCTGESSMRLKTISGTPGYTCPIYTRTGCITEGSEVYSFGMCMLEFLCAMSPAMADPKGPGLVRYPIAENIAPSRPGAVQRAVSQADPDASWPLPLASEIATLAVRCVNDMDENARPNFVEIVRALRGMAQTFQEIERGSFGFSPTFAAQVPQILPHLSEPAQGSPQMASQLAAKAMGGYPFTSGAHVVQQLPQQQTPLAQMPIALVLMSAAGADVDALPRKLTLSPTAPSRESGPGAKLTSYVGRQHQHDLFQAWLPDKLSVISRTAFEVVLGPARSSEADALWVVVRGGNPMTVDGQIAPRGSATPVQLGSDVGFTFTTDERSTFLSLRLQPTTAALPPPGPPAGAFVVASAPAPASAASGQATPASLAMLPPAAPSHPVSTAGVWHLECVKAQGLTPESINALPVELRRFAIQDMGAVLLGRQHQPQLFEALLAGAQSYLTFISRTHVQFEVRKGGLFATNMSANPIYIDGNSLDKGSSCQLKMDDILNFVDKNHSTVLSLRVCVVQAAHDRQCTAGVWAVHEGKAIHGGIDNLLVETMTPEEAILKATRLPDCIGFCYEGTTTGGPFTIFFKSKWETETAPGWTAYQYKINRRLTAVVPPKAVALSTQEQVLQDEMARRRGQLEHIRAIVESKIEVLRSCESKIGLASAPHNRVTQLIQDFKDRYTGYFFHPDTDFGQFGVGPLSSAHWLFCWGQIATVAGEKNGDVFFMKYVSGEFEGSQQAGELDLALKTHGLNVHEVLYDDTCKFVSQRRLR